MLPFIIFEGLRIQQSRLPDDIDNNIVIQVSPNGWTDCSIALHWLKYFNDYTAPRTIGKHRLLVLDGHASHVSPAFADFCANNGIIPLCLLRHSTHILQLLDGLDDRDPFAVARLGYECLCCRPRDDDLLALANTLHAAFVVHVVDAVVGDAVL